ncbi:2-oxoglutarate carboxylase large subunit [compost metagenome]
MASNIHFLQNLLRQPGLAAGVDTRFIERQLSELLAPQQAAHPHLFFAGMANANATQAGQAESPAGCVPLNAPSQGVLVSLDVQVGDAVATGQPVAVLEAMKMEHPLKSGIDGVLKRLQVKVGDQVKNRQILLEVE